jgi:biotin operon repressor
MRAKGPLRTVEDQLIKDLEKTTQSFAILGKKYGASRQAILAFCSRRGIKRPKREHTETCSICQELIRIAKKPHSDFISSQTIKKQLGLGKVKFLYHIGILRKKGLISQKFRKLHSKRLELAYQIYFKKRLPVRIIGRQSGLKNFHSTIQKHKASGWDVPAPLFKYDGKERSIRLKIARRKKKG